MGHRLFGGAWAVVRPVPEGAHPGDLPRTLGAPYKGLVNGFGGQYVPPP